MVLYGYARASLRQIGQGLRERGIPSPRGGAWSASAVRRVLVRAQRG
jgi:hypothetical protein